MNFSLSKKHFYEAVHTVARFAQQKNPSVQMLSSVLILVKGNEIRFRATNLETGIDYKLNGDCISDGVVLVQASLLQQIAGSLVGDGSIVLEHVGDILTIKSDTNKTSIKTIPYEDFPSIPIPDNTKNRVVLQGGILKNLFTAIIPCASTSTIRPELSSLFISIEGGFLTVVGTDSFRLAEKKFPLQNLGSQGKLLIPAKNAVDIAQALPDEDVIFSFNEHQCAFVSTKNTLVSRLTNAVYPDYKQIIPKEFVVEAVVLRKDFEQALKRTAIFSDSFQKIKINFDSKKNNVSVFAKNNDVGESIDTINAKVNGNNIDLSFNHRYLSTILSLTHSESLSLSASGVGRPLIIKGVNDASVLYLVSSMNQ